MTLNEKTVKLELQRIDICNLLIACTSLSHSTNAEKWGELHNKLEKILDNFDSEQEI
jgi:hypothetical protein